jgi:PAS domain S-box-containing protein
MCKASIGESSYASFFSKAPDLFCISDDTGLIVDASERWSHCLGWPRDSIIGRSCRDFVHAEDLPSVESVFSRLGNEGAAESFVVRMLGARGEIKRVEWNIVSVGKSFFATGRDVGAYIDSRELLREANRRVDRILESISDSFLSLDASLQCTYANNAASRVFGMPRNELIGKSLLDIVPEARGTELEANLRQALDERISLSFQTKVPFAGADEWYEVRAFPFEGGVSVYIAVITDRKETERKLKDAVREGEALMHELEHRVKNSLMIASSLLSLESHRIKDPEAKEVMRSAEAKLNSISLIYEKLYRSKSLNKIGLDDYLRDLAELLVEQYASPGLRVELKMELGSVEIDAKRAGSIGLIVTELITNSMKYAFSGRESGAISLRTWVSRRKAKGGSGSASLSIEYSDDGAGLPKGFDPATDGGFGLQIINLQASQFDAKLAFDTKGPGFKATISYPWA